MSVAEIYSAVTASCTGPSSDIRLTASDRQIEAQIRAWSDGLVRIARAGGSNASEVDRDSEVDQDSREHQDSETETMTVTPPPSETSEVDQPFVQMIHPSVDDFLDGEGLVLLTDWQDSAKLPATSSQRDIRRQRRHASLYWVCLRHLNSWYAQNAASAPPLRASRNVPVVTYRKALLEDPFLKYVSEHALHHGQKAGRYRAKDFQEEARLLDMFAGFQDAYDNFLVRRGFRCALDIAVTIDLIDLARYLLERDSKHDTDAHLDGITLVFAASGGHLHMVDLLLEYGVSIGDVSLGGWSALHYAGSHGREQMTRTLLQHGADANVRDKMDCTPLHYVEKEGIVQLLLRYGANVNARDEEGRSALHRAASYPHSAEIVQLLLQYKADVNVKTNKGVSVLHWALRREEVDSDTIGLLLERGADVNAKDNEGNSVLHWALRHGEVNKDIVQLLLANHAVPATKEESERCSQLGQVDRSQ